MFLEQPLANYIQEYANMLKIYPQYLSTCLNANRGPSYFSELQLSVKLKFTPNEKGS